jgi:hypothetical protein
MTDIDLPLWPIPPNWGNGVTERLSWLTDIQVSRSGVEQRQAKRLSPRREFEFRINPAGNARSYFDQWMHRIPDERCLLPLWHDVNELTSDVEMGATFLPFDTAFSEFETGGLGVVFQSTFKFEIVSIASVGANGLNLVAGLSRAWYGGSQVYPVRRAWMDPETQFTALSSRLGEATLGFMIDGPNDYPAGAEALPVYEGYPLITLEPNRRDDLEVQFARDVEELDNSIGLIRRFDETGRSFQTQFYNWTAYGREEHHLLRQTFYRLKGRQKAFWMPSFNEDITLARPLLVGQSQLSIEQIGYRALGGVIAGRDHVVIRDDYDASRVLSIIGTSAGLSEDEERLNLSGVVDFSLAAGQSGSFLSIMRLENDVIEIQHHTDSNGVCEAGVACKSFANDRTNAGPFIDPRPVAIKSDEPCGP